MTDNVAHGGMNGCKTEIKPRLGGARRDGVAAIFPQLRGLIPQGKIVGENEGGGAVKTPLRHGRG